MRMRGGSEVFHKGLDNAAVHQGQDVLKTFFKSCMVEQGALAT